ncbi:MAG: SGNH/GDSL hydrolase family protein [Candidatus Spyradenecus sp.]
MKFAYAFLCALGLSLALTAPLYAQEETSASLTYTWQELASNVSSFSYDLTSSSGGIIYANNERGFAGSFTLSEGALTDTTIVEVFGDTGKYVKFSINSVGNYVLSVYKGSGTAPTATATTSALTATPGVHRFALFIRRGDGNGNDQRMAYTSVIIDGATTLTCTSTSDNYSDGPFRGVKSNGKTGMTLSAKMWRTAGSVSGDGATTTLAIEADAAQMYPITETNSVVWSNLEETTTLKATHFTKASEAATLLLPAQEGVKVGRRVIVTAVKIANNSSKTMQDTMTINGATSASKTTDSTWITTTGAVGSTSYTFDTCYVYTFPVGRRPVVTVGESYSIVTPGENQLAAIKAEGPIQIGLTGDWDDYTAYCAVEGLAALEPEATVASVTADTGEGLTGGGVVSVTLERLFAGTYADSDLSFVLRFDGVEADVPGTRNELALSFTLPAETFVPGNVYRGQLVLVYPDGEQVLAPVKVYEGTPTIVTEADWVNETPETLGSTGTWSAETGIGTYKSALEVDADGGVTFTPEGHVDYAATCDSTWTVQLVADEAFAASAESNPEAEVQGAVRIAEVDSALKVSALEVQVWQDGTWKKLCDATAGETYTVTVDFHYAKSKDEIDTITYTCGGVTLSSERPAGSAQVVTAISVSDGTQLAALTAERELDQALVNAVTVTADSGVQDLGSGALPERITVQGTFGYGKHPLLTYSGSGNLASVHVEGLTGTLETYVEEGENGVKTWGITEKTLVIYPVGDSITYGASRRLKTPANVDLPVPGGYRLPLYTRLTSAGYTVKYVGDTNTNPAEGLNGEIYHSGHAGWKVDDNDSIYDNVTGWATTVKGQAGRDRDPDVILLLLGVNDLNGGEAPATTAEQMKKLIWRLAGIGPAVDGDTPLYPNAKLLLAKVLDSTYATSSVKLETLSTKIGEYNTALETFVNGLTAEQGSARIRLVDLKTPLDAANGFNYFRYDNLHPSAEGYTQMARNWFAAVEDFLPPLNQAQSATVRVTESLLADQLTLTFSKAMDKAAAETASNYTLSNGTVSAATLLDDGLTVRLTLTDTTPGAEATLTVAAMADKAGVQSTAASLPVRIGATAQRSTDIADSVCNRTADGYTNPLELIAEWSAFPAAPTESEGLPAQFGAARRAERPWTLKLHRQGEHAPTVENGLLCLNGGTVTVEVNSDFVASQSGHYWTVLVETVDTVTENTVLFTMHTTGEHDILGTAPFEDLYGLRTGTAGTVVTVNAGVDVAVSGFADVSASNVAYTRKRNQFVTSFGSGGYATWVNSQAVSFASDVSGAYYSGKTPLHFTFGGTYLTTSAAAFTQGSNLKIARIAICLGRANADILTASRYRFNPADPATDTNWSTLANWQTYGATAGDLPATTETVYTAPDVTATMDQAATVANLVAEGPLTVAGTNALTISGDLSIPGTLTVNTSGGVSAAMLKTTGAREVAGSGTLTIADVTLGETLTISGKLVWNASATTERSEDNAVKVTPSGSLTTTGWLKLNNGNDELLGTTLVKSGILTVNPPEKKLGGTLTVDPGATFRLHAANTKYQLNHEGTATVNVYGTLDMNNCRWAIGANNTLNFFPGATVTAGFQTENSQQYGAFDILGSANTLNFKAADSKGTTGDITFNATLRAQQPITLNVESGVTVNFNGNGRSASQGDADDTATVKKTGNGLMKVATNFTFDAATSGPLQVSNGSTLELAATGNKANITVDEGATLLISGAGNGNSNNLAAGNKITNNGTVELRNGHAFISINGGKTIVTCTTETGYTFGFGAPANPNTFNTDLEIAEGAKLRIGTRRDGAGPTLSGLKNLGTITPYIDTSVGTSAPDITLQSGATVSGTGTIGVPVVAEAGVTLDASERKALTFSRGLTLEGPLAVKAAEAKADLCTIQGTLPEVSAFTFASGSSLTAEGHCFVLKDGTTLQALPKVTLPTGSESSETLSEAITRALEAQVRDGVTTISSLIATEAGGTEANPKRSAEAAELFTNIISATEVSATQAVVKVAYDFNVSQMTIVNGETLLLCARVSNVPKENIENNSADYAKGTVVCVYQTGEDTPLVTARELSDSDYETYGVARAQGEKWFAVPLDAMSGQTNTFIIKASR